MTHEEKVTFLRIAMSLQEIGINDQVSDQIITTYEALLVKGGEFNIHDAVEIHKNITLKYEMKTKEETKQ